MKKLLFVCTANIARSKTAEEIYKKGYDIKSAGAHELAVNVLTRDLVEWADEIYVFENWHKMLIEERYPDLIKNKKIVNLDIGDYYLFNDPELINLIRERMKEYLS